MLTKFNVDKVMLIQCATGHAGDFSRENELHLTYQY